MIQNKRELKAEKKRLRQREKELKKQISSSWKELKSSLQPKALMAGHFESKNIPHNGEDSILVSAISYAAALLGRKLGEKAEEKLGDMFGSEK